MQDACVMHQRTQKHTWPPLASAAFCLASADTRCSSFIFLASLSRSDSSSSARATSSSSILLSSSAFLLTQAWTTSGTGCSVLHLTSLYAALILCFLLVHTLRSPKPEHFASEPRLSRLDAQAYSRVAHFNDLGSTILAKSGPHPVLWDATPEGLPDLGLQQVALQLILGLLQFLLQLGHRPAVLLLSCCPWGTRLHEDKAR